MHQVNPFFEHVVQIFRHRRHLFGITLHRDHGHLHCALPQSFARTIDRGISAADDGYARAQLDLGRAHADVAKEGKSVKNAVLFFPFGFHTVGFSQAHSQHAGVVIFLEAVPSNVFPDFNAGLDRHSELFETLDLAVENVLGQYPIWNTAAIESARLRRLFENRDFISETRQLVGGAVPGRTGSDDGDFLAVGFPGLHHVVRQGLAEIAQKALDRADRDGFVVLSTIAGLLAGVVADPAGDRWKGHVFLDESVSVQIFAALHEVEIALNLFVSSARVIARGQLVSIDRSDGAPVAGREKVLPFFLRRRGGDTGERNLKPVGNTSAFGRHLILSYTATGFSGIMCNSLSATSNACLFAIMGSMVFILTMPVVLTTAAISGAAISGAIDLFLSAAPSVERRSSPSSPSR